MVVVGSLRCQVATRVGGPRSTSAPELFNVVKGLGRPYVAGPGRSRSVAKGGDRVSREGRFSSRRWFPPGGSTAVG